MNQAATKVDELTNYPFSDFQDMKNRIHNGEYKIMANRLMSLEFFSTSPLIKPQYRIIVSVLGFMPYIIPLLLLIYSFIAKSWLTLIGLPLIAIEVFFSLPQIMRSFPILKLLMAAIAIVVFNIGYVWEYQWLSYISASLVVVWFSNILFFGIIVSETIRVSLRYEAIFCLQWKYKVIHLENANGDLINADGCTNLSKILDEIAELDD